MIQRVLQQEEAITQVLSADKKARHLILSWQDIHVLESIHKVLGPLLEFTDALSAEAYVTVSYVKPVLHLFESDILAPKEDDTELTGSIKRAILDYLREKYDDPATQELLNMASFIDPRFRSTYVPESKIEELKERVTSEAEALLPELPTSQSDAAATPTEEATPAAKREKRSLGSFFKQPVQQHTKTQRELIEAELSGYLHGVKPDSDTDPLRWWKAHEANYPRLSNLAKKYLCVPATSSPSERAFSASGNIVTCHRASLKPETVDRLVFLSYNL